MKKVLPLKMVSAFFGLVAAGSVSATGISLEEFNEIADQLAPIATVDGSSQSFAIVPVFADGSDDLVIGYGVPRQQLAWDSGDKVFSSGASYTAFDPVITTSIGVIDVGVASNFAIATAAPLVPPITTAAQGTVTIAGSFADGGTDGGSATPLFGLMAGATIEGVGVAGVGPAALFSSPTDTYGPFSVDYNFDCSALPDGQCDSFDLLIAFTGSGGRDAISFTARHVLNPVPVPAALPLFLSALFGLGAVARRKRKLSAG